ncbi:MAG: universal stress protein [Chloroflexota bacterium]
MLTDALSGIRVEHSQWVAVRTPEPMSHRYRRVLVVLSGSRRSEQAIRPAMDLAREHDAHLIVIDTDKLAAAGRVKAIVHKLRKQGLQVHGYAVAGLHRRDLAWVVQSEDIDVVLVAKHAIPWFGRRLARHLRETANIEVLIASQ